MKANRVVGLLLAGLTALAWAASAAAAGAGGNDGFDEALLCRRIEQAYTDASAAQKGRERSRDLHLERLCYLILVAGAHAQGSPRLDAVFARLRRESPTLVVPRHVMAPAELESLIAEMAKDDGNEYVFAAYQVRVRYLTELVDLARRRITERSGYKFTEAASDRD